MFIDGNGMTPKTDGPSGREILDMEWPAPLVSMEAIATHAPWLAESSAIVLAFAPPRLIDVATLVTSQENACRFCYGALRAAMRISGYSDTQIRDLERDVQLADGLTREVVSLSRKLARSSPRPVREELAALLSHGLDAKAAAEIVFVIASSCFFNRIGTFLALPPERRLERSAETGIGRLIGSIVMRASHKTTRKAGPSTPVVAEGVLAPLIRELPDAPIAAWFARLLGNCFGSPALPRRTKLLILAVVARTLGCHFCEDAAQVELQETGLDRNEFMRILETLSGPELTPADARVLDWARETVHYETGLIQKRTRALAGTVGVGVLLEAVATAAVSNTAVRLAMLLE